jgi:hypothetical protein
MSSYGKEMMGLDPLPAIVTGMSWKSQLAEKIFSETGDKKLKSWFGEHGWNTGLIDTLVSLSVKELLPGANKVTAMTANSKASKATVESFLKNVDTYRNVKTTPSILSTGGELLSQIAKGAGNLAKGAGDTGIALPWILGVLAVGVGGYLIFAGRKGVNLTPKFSPFK